MELYVSDTCPQCPVVLRSPLAIGLPVYNTSRDLAARQTILAAGIRSVPALHDSGYWIVGAHAILGYLSSKARGG